MSKGTYSHSNRHRMHEPQVTNYDEVAHLKGVITELKKENEELKKDKERLDWLVDNASISMLRKDEDGEEWWVELAYSEARKDIDEYMNQSPSIFDDLSDSQRQQICHEHGQPTK